MVNVTRSVSLSPTFRGGSGSVFRDILVRREERSSRNIDSQLQVFQGGRARLTVPTVLAFHHWPELRNVVIGGIIPKQRLVSAVVRQKLMIAALCGWVEGRCTIVDENRNTIDKKQN
jgi:hypothetical protein